MRAPTGRRRHALPARSRTPVVTARPPVVEAWHRVVETRDPALLGPLLADGCVFRSPAVHAPQEGKRLTLAYLSAALVVLGPTLTYHRELFGDDSAVLEFTATLDGLDVHGVDLVRWDADGQIVDFTVMVRPLRGLEKLVALMRAQLEGRG
ncbi:MAG: nuclear transport factor 2 family protein [Actinobacteria bacterium]|nr:nuclear transport factor 2 family protein [Actinomycetota bacterium]